MKTLIRCMDDMPKSVQIPTSFYTTVHSSVKKMQGWGFIYLPSLLYHPYLVCIRTFWCAILTSFYISNVFIFFISISRPGWFVVASTWLLKLLQHIVSAQLRIVTLSQVPLCETDPSTDLAAK